MAPNPDAEKDLENGTTAANSTASHSDVEKAELRNMEEGATGEPDSDHDEVEQMDEGHLDDLARHRVRQPTSLQIASLTLQDGGIYQSWKTSRVRHSSNNIEIEFEEQTIPNSNESYFEKQESATCACASTDFRSGQGNCRMGRAG